MNKRITVLVFGILCMALGSCKKYLNVVPDDVATIDYAFQQRTTAEQYLFTCYSYMPDHGNPFTDPAYLAGDEFWLFYPYAISGYPLNVNAWEIARGNQSVTAPLMSYWDGSNGAPNLWKAIRDCNIFLENINSVPDMDQYEKDQWASETTFLKAYYHYWLIRMYGPVPIVDKNLPINATQDQVQVERQTIDSCFNYVVKTIDSAMTNLLPVIEDQTNQMGRISQTVALAIKAEVLTTAASPLFNGNVTYSSFKNKAGKPFFNQAPDLSKWQKAADACKAAIDNAAANGNRLNHYMSTLTTNLPADLQTEMDIRTAVTDNFNAEVVWGNTNSLATDLQSLGQPRPNVTEASNFGFYGMASIPFNIVNTFYTKNGVPTDEDRTLDFSTRGASTRVAVAGEGNQIFTGYTSAAINFDREPRFYADLGFDGSILYGNGNQTLGALNYLQAKQGQYSGWEGTPNNWNTTGYWPVKVVNYQNTFPSVTTYTIQPYAFPAIRLASLYLLYAEALNEVSGPSDNNVFMYVDSVRARAGLKGVKESWTDFSNNPSKFNSQDGMRQIIHRERTIELAFEGQRFWDLRRWKESEKTWQEPIQGWAVAQSDLLSYYTITTLFNRTFQLRDYFWPIAQSDLLVNKNLVQNPGW